MNQQAEFRVCPRCIGEGTKRIVRNNDPTIRRQRCQTPMRYSKVNTSIEFEYWNPNHPLQGLNLVEQSLIALISPVVIIKTIEGMIMRYSRMCLGLIITTCAKLTIRRSGDD